MNRDRGYMVQRWLLVWFLLISALALFWPEGSQALFSLIPIAKFPWLIFVAMFFIGAMLPREEVLAVARNWSTVLGGTAVQYLSMPLLAFILGKLFQLDDDNFVGIVMAGCVPGAMASNVLTLNAHGNASYSVGLTTLATMLSPFMVPLTMGLALQHWDDSQKQKLWDAAITLGWSVVLPVVLGFAVAQLSKRGAQLLSRIGPTVANLMILWVIGAVIAANRERLLHEFQWNVVAALVGLNALGYAAGYVGALLMQLDEPKRRALTLEVGMQNAGLGATLALALFPDRSAVAIAPTLFMFGCMLSGTMLSNGWAWADRRQDKVNNVTRTL